MASQTMMSIAGAAKRKRYKTMPIMKKPMLRDNQPMPMRKMASAPHIQLPRGERPPRDPVKRRQKVLRALGTMSEQGPEQKRTYSWATQERLSREARKKGWLR